MSNIITSRVKYFIHDCFVHPIMPFLPKRIAIKWHDWTEALLWKQSVHKRIDGISEELYGENWINRPFLWRLIHDCIIHPIVSFGRVGAPGLNSIHDKHSSMSYNTHISRIK